MKKKISLITSLSFIGLSAVLSFGNVYAKWAVTDNAQAKNILISLSSDNRVLVEFLDYDGSSIYSESVLKGETISSIPSNPTKSGYVFDGWTTDTTTYDKTSDVIGTTTYTSPATYRPRYVSYGYKKTSGDATRIDNVRDRTKNVSLTSSETITLGTFVLGKTSSLEKTTAVTVSNAGDYIFYCGDQGSSWDGSKSPVSSNWHVEKCYTYTITDAMKINGYGLFGHFFNNTDTQTEIMTDNLISGNQYYVYGPSFATKVIFGALYSSNPRSMGNNWDNVIKQFSEITLDSTSAYSAPATEKTSLYFRGASYGWDPVDEAKLSVSFDSNNKGEMLQVSLTANQEFKIGNNNWSQEWGYWGYYDGSDHWPEGGVLHGDTSYFEDQGLGSGRQNIKCKTTGIYNFYLNNSNELWVFKVS